MLMKNTLLTSALVAILGLAFVGAPVTAQAQSTNATAATAPKAKTKEAKTPYKGSITAIDASSVTVANKSTTLTLAIAATTKFEKDKKPATIADFAVGDMVTGSYTKDATGAMTAASLHKKTMTAKAAKTSTGTAPAAAPATTPATN
jgi:ketopantoate hydroxymethyltransferase